MKNSKKNLLNSRLRYNKSQIPILKKDRSFISTKLNSMNLKDKLMNYDFNIQKFNPNIDNRESHQKTSLILPPLSIGNMQRTLERRSSRDRSRKQYLLMNNEYSLDRD